MSQIKFLCSINWMMNLNGFLKEQKNDDGNNDDSNDVMLIFLIRRDDIDIKQKDDIQLLANM